MRSCLDCCEWRTETSRNRSRVRPVAKAISPKPSNLSCMHDSCLATPCVVAFIKRLQESFALSGTSSGLEANANMMSCFVDGWCWQSRYVLHTSMHTIMEGIDLGY